MLRKRGEGWREGKDGEGKDRDRDKERREKRERHFPRVIHFLRH
jgi:hypothetical protein